MGKYICYLINRNEIELLIPNEVCYSTISLMLNKEYIIKNYFDISLVYYKNDYNYNNRKCKLFVFGNKSKINNHLKIKIFKKYYILKERSEFFKYLTGYYSYKISKSKIQYLKKETKKNNKQYLKKYHEGKLFCELTPFEKYCQSKQLLTTEYLLNNKHEFIEKLINPKIILFNPFDIKQYVKYRNLKFLLEFNSIVDSYFKSVEYSRLGLKYSQEYLILACSRIYNSSEIIFKAYSQFKDYDFDNNINDSTNIINSFKKIIDELIYDIDNNIFENVEPINYYKFINFFKTIDPNNEIPEFKQSFMKHQCVSLDIIKLIVTRTFDCISKIKN